MCLHACMHAKDDGEIKNSLQDRHFQLSQQARIIMLSHAPKAIVLLHSLR